LNFRSRGKKEGGGKWPADRIIFAAFIEESLAYQRKLSKGTECGLERNPKSMNGSTAVPRKEKGQ